MIAFRWAVWVCAAALGVGCGGKKAPAAPSGGGATGGAGGLVRAGASGGDVLAAGLHDTSAWFAPGMTPDGPMAKATLAPKGRARTDLALKAGKCYKVVGFSPQGQVTDFDLRLLAADGSVIAEDSDDDTTPTVGNPDICPTADVGYGVEMVADKGAGDVAVQLYSKAK